MNYSDINSEFELFSRIHYQVKIATSDRTRNVTFQEVYYDLRILTDSKLANVSNDQDFMSEFRYSI